MRPTGTIQASKILKKIEDILIISKRDDINHSELKEAQRILSFRNLPIKNLIEKHKKKPIKEISSDVFKILSEIEDHKEPEILKTLKSQINKEYQELLNIKGLGAKKVLLLNEELNIININQLLTAINDNSILKIKGFAEKSVLSLKEAAEFYLSVKGLIRLDQHESILRQIKNLLKDKNIKTIESGQSFEKDETFEKIELSCESSCIEDIIKILGSTEIKLINKDKEKAIFNYNENKLFINFSESAEFLKLEEEKNEKKIRLEKSLSKKDIRGIIHSHTTYSDGLNSILEMSMECQDLGFSYIAISDHSKSSKYANGLSLDRLTKQKKEILEINQKNKDFKIYSCIESDILKDGSLDYDDTTLSQLDFVIISIHSNFEMNKEEMTSRICKAIANPYTTILAHPTGRLLLERKGYEVDVEQILNTIKKHNKILELNCNPKRLDLSWKHLGLAKEMGIKICLSPDAHSTDQIEYIEYGILMARKAGLNKHDIINCMEIKQFEDFLCTTQKKQL